jgi:aspartyl-tRNA(Asn)/glutamyl-tRNA(Gln) amidotransferase subunit A
MAGYDPLDPSTVPVPVPDFTSRLGQDLRGLKIGIPSNYYFDIIDTEVETAVRRAISTLEELGIEAREVALPSM